MMQKQQIPIYTVGKQQLMLFLVYLYFEIDWCLDKTLLCKSE